MTPTRAATDAPKLPLISACDTPAPVNGIGDGVLVLDVVFIPELGEDMETVPEEGGTTPSAVCVANTCSVTVVGGAWLVVSISIDMMSVVWAIFWKLLEHKDQQVAR